MVECFASAAEDVTTKSLAFDVKVHIFTEGEELYAEKENHFASSLEKHFNFTGECFSSTAEDNSTKSLLSSLSLIFKSL